MRSKSWIPVVAALVLGAIAAFVARKSLPTSLAISGPKMTSVVVARGAIAPGAALTADMLTTAAIGGLTAPPDTFVSPTEIVGRVTTVPIVQGQAIQGSFFAPTGASAGLQALIPTGLRAVTVDVSESGGLAGLIVPGCRVDVVTTEISQDPGKTISRLVVQNLPVVAVGQRLGAVKTDDKDKDNKEPALARTVTLLATPRQAEALDVGLVAARIRLILRSNSDKEQVTDEGVALAELIGERGGAPTPAPVAPVMVPETVVVTTPPSPATQPSVFSKPVDEAPARLMTVITGNDERHITFKESRPAHTELSDTPQDNIVRN